MQYFDYDNLVDWPCLTNMRGPYLFTHLRSPDQDMVDVHWWWWLNYQINGCISHSLFSMLTCALILRIRTDFAWLPDYYGLLLTHSSMFGGKSDVDHYLATFPSLGYVSRAGKGTCVLFWWAPTRNRRNFAATKPVVWSEYFCNLQNASETGSIRTKGEQIYCEEPWIIS